VLRRGHDVLVELLLAMSILTIMAGVMGGLALAVPAKYRVFARTRGNRDSAIRE